MYRLSAHRITMSGMWDIPDASCNAAWGFPCSIFFSSVFVCNVAFHRVSDPSHGSPVHERSRHDTEKSRHNSCLLLYHRTDHFHNMEKSVPCFISGMRLSSNYFTATRSRSVISDRLFFNESDTDRSYFPVRFSGQTLSQRYLQ